MKIGLIDVDSHNFPNLALMKLSAYHRAKGHNVEWWNGLVRYDRVYMSKVFTEEYTPDMEFCINADEIIRGGSGYDLKNKLPDDVEHTYPDYSLYGIADTAYGFTTRGCPRSCDFCIVSGKEGRKSVRVADVNEFWSGQKEIKLLDPNLLACKEAGEILDQLISTGARIDFTQGLDIRCMTDKYADQIGNMKTSMIHFAWDNYEFNTYEKLKHFRPAFKQRSRELRVYVLTNFNTNFEQDRERVEKLVELDYDPYLMIFNKPNAPKELRKYQRYVNNKYIFRSCKWEEYR